MTRPTPLLPQAIPHAIFTFVFGVAIMYISIFLHTLMYKEIGNIMTLYPCTPTSPAVVSWGSWTRVIHVAHPR
jgi:hypothetical protein